MYRHLLFNRLGRSDDKLDPSILRLGTLLLLFDVYLTWARAEDYSLAADTTPPPSAASLTTRPILLQYIFFLTLNILATLAHHITIRLLVWIFLSNTTSSQVHTGRSSHSQPPSRSEKQNSQARNHSTGSTAATDLKPTVGPGVASPSAVSTALLVSSCMKLFPILLVIWPESSGESNGVGIPQSFARRARSYVGWAVLLNNIEALLILLDRGYLTAAGLALAGTTARWVIEGAMLAVAGLEGERGPVGDILGCIESAVNMLPSR